MAIRNNWSNIVGYIYSNIYLYTKCYIFIPDKKYYFECKKDKQKIVELSGVINDVVKDLKNYVV